MKGLLSKLDFLRKVLNVAGVIPPCHSPALPPPISTTLPAFYGKIDAMCTLYPGTTTGTADGSSQFLWQAIIAEERQISIEQIHNFPLPISLQPEVLR